jgi:hypothetical protein
MQKWDGTPLMVWRLAGLTIRQATPGMGRLSGGRQPEMLVATDAYNRLIAHLSNSSLGGNVNLLLGLAVFAFHRHHDKALVGHRCISAGHAPPRGIPIRTAPARPDSPFLLFSFHFGYDF